MAIHFGRVEVVLVFSDTSETISVSVLLSMTLYRIPSRESSQAVTVYPPSCAISGMAWIYEFRTEEVCDTWTGVIPPFCTHLSDASAYEYMLD
jgi:hypothetical protein